MGSGMGLVVVDPTKPEPSARLTNNVQSATLSRNYHRESPKALGEQIVHPFILDYLAYFTRLRLCC